MSWSFDKHVRCKVISAVAGVVLALGVVGVQPPSVFGFEETNSPGSCDDEIIDRPGGAPGGTQTAPRNRSIDVP